MYEALNLFNDIFVRYDDYGLNDIKCQRFDNCIQLISKEGCDEACIIELLLRREMLIDILESLPISIQVADRNGKILYVNNYFLEVLGIEAKDRIGRDIFEVSPDGSLAKVLKMKRPVINLRNTPKGTPTELVSSAVPLYYKGNLIGAVAIMHDIRDVVSLTDMLRESRNMVEGLSEKIRYLSQANYSFDDIITESNNMKRAIEIAKAAAGSDSTILIQGESGNGKELFAHAIHNASMRYQEPFVCVNCSAIPENLLESEFFGHEKGAFTGATKQKLGKFELANKGTLFLDEIGDMPLTLQPKILRAIQERKIQRVGGEKEVKLDIRIIAATNRDLKQMVEKGEFRSDLYYRLHVIPIIIPPLRERKEDLFSLSKHLSRKICRRLGRRTVHIDDSAINTMNQYNWPGNVRELENIIERAILGLENRNIIECKDLGYLLTGEKDALEVDCTRIVPLNKLEKQAIKDALNHFGHSYEAKVKISEGLGISLATLYNKINKYNIYGEKVDIHEL